MEVRQKKEDDTRELFKKRHGVQDAEPENQPRQLTGFFIKIRAVDKDGARVKVREEKHLNNQPQGGDMKYVILGFVLWLAFILPSSAKSAEETGYRVVQIKEGLTVLMGADQTPQICSDYFFSIESPKGKKIYFNYERKGRDTLSTEQIFEWIGKIYVNVDEREKYPRVIIVGIEPNAQYYLSLNRKDFVEGLPCLVDGRGPVMSASIPSVWTTF